MKIRIFGFCLLFVVLLACAAPVQPISNTPALSTAVSQATIQQPIITQPFNPTSSPQSSATPETIGPEKVCLEVTGDTQQILDSQNGLIMLAQDRSTSQIYDKLNSPYLYDPYTEKKIEIPGGSGFTVSLDNEQMAYVSNNDELIITDATGKPISSRPFLDVQIIQWVRNGLIVEDNERQQVFINPFTGERRKLTINFPNLYPVEYGFDPYWSPEVIFDPSLTKAVFPGFDQSKSQTYITLWDITDQKELSRTSQGAASSFLPQTKPEWSNDGKQVVVAAINDNKIQLMSLKDDGSIQVIWNITKGLGTMFFSLSPDQKNIAFWSPDPNTSQISNLALYVLELTTKKATNYCIISPNATFKPIWSPDSKQLAVEIKKDQASSDVVVVDLEKNIAFKIAENAQPVGWLK